MRKTIRIDLEAYGRLKAAKRGRESFSQVIMRLFPKPVDVKKWLKRISNDPFSVEFQIAVEKQIKGRRSRRNLR